MSLKTCHIFTVLICALCRLMGFINTFNKVWCQKDFRYLKESNVFIQQGSIQLVKSDSRDFNVVTKTFFQINAFELSDHQRILNGVHQISIL